MTLKMISIAAMFVAMVFASESSQIIGSKTTTTTVVCASAKDQYNYDHFGIIGPSCRVIAASK